MQIHSDRHAPYQCGRVNSFSLFTDFVFIVLHSLSHYNFIFSSDGKIIVHDRGSEYSIAYNGHNQEVNCVDCKGGVIVSGSRDRTAKVRF